MIEEKKDRIGHFLAPHLKELIFDELSYEYLERAGLKDILTDIPVPLRKDELNAINTFTIAKGMAFVIGCDPSFKYKDNYVTYILRLFGKEFADALINAEKNGVNILALSCNVDENSLEILDDVKIDLYGKCE